jgi:hypothetical protein
MVGCEIDTANDAKIPRKFRYLLRKLVLAAEIECHAVSKERHPYSAGIVEYEDGKPVAKTLSKKCTDIEEWQDLIDSISEAILWDRDYDEAESFLDDEPELRDLKYAAMGIRADYFTAVAPNPTDKEMKSVRRQLRQLCGLR